MSDSTTYHVERAPSGRAKCKKCKEVIAKGELRIATNSYKESTDMNFTSYNHPRCFNVPPRAMKGVSPADFVSDHLEDRTDDSILSDPTQRQEIVDAVAYKPPRGGKKEKGDDEQTTELARRLAGIRKAMEALDSDDDDAPPAKRARKDKKGKGGKAGPSTEELAGAMRVYSKMKADDLKSVLRWNLGYGTTGTKDVLLLRCIDGHVNGRLARCPSCFKGKLGVREEDGGATVACRGYFDEEIQQRIPCSYTSLAASAPRLYPWHTEEPSEEEMEAMKEITKEAEAVASGKGGGSVPRELMDAAEEMDWPIANPKERAQAMVDLCTTLSAKVDLPQDEKKARIAVGKLLMNLLREDDGATAVRALEAIVAEFGISADKAEARARQKSALGGNCACAANAGVVQAFQELGDLYFKDGNSNAGLSYKKAVAALSALDYEITADNAKGLCKGKTKVAGIGKGSADKIYEFFTTGTIQKLEEKRTVHS